MLETLNRRLTENREKKRLKNKWEHALRECKAELKKADERRLDLRLQLRMEREDVDRLEGLSLTNLFATVLGKKEERLNKERQEWLKAKLAFDEAEQTVKDLNEEMKSLQEQLQSVRNVEQEYEEILRQKEEWIQQNDTSLAREIYRLSEKAADLKADDQELKEAIDAGRSVIHALDRVESSLDKAKGWGTFDMMGGGMLATAMKHSHIDNAKGLVHTAQMKFRRFQQELEDVRQQLQIQIDIQGLLAFADYFFDGLIADWTVQNRIHDARRQVHANKRKVDAFIQKLRTHQHQVQQEISRIDDAMTAKIERAGMS